MNLLWLMDSIDALNTATPNGRQTYFGQWTPREWRIDALNTATPNLADEHTWLMDTPIASWDIYYGIDLAAMFWILQEKVEFPLISE